MNGWPAMVFSTIGKVIAWTNSRITSVARPRNDMGLQNKEPFSSTPLTSSSLRKTSAFASINVIFNEKTSLIRVRRGTIFFLFPSALSWGEDVSRPCAVSFRWNNSGNLPTTLKVSRYTEFVIFESRVTLSYGKLFTVSSLQAGGPSTEGRYVSSRRGGGPRSSRTHAVHPSQPSTRLQQVIFSIKMS